MPTQTLILANSCMCMCVCVCVCERESVCVCVYSYRDSSVPFGSFSRGFKLAGLSPAKCPAKSPAKKFHSKSQFILPNSFQLDCVFWPGHVIIEVSSMKGE